MRESDPKLKSLGASDEPELTWPKTLPEPEDPTPESMDQRILFVLQRESLDLHALVLALYPTLEEGSREAALTLIGYVRRRVDALLKRGDLTHEPCGKKLCLAEPPEALLGGDLVKVKHAEQLGVLSDQGQHLVLLQVQELAYVVGPNGGLGEIEGEQVLVRSLHDQRLYALPRERVTKASPQDLPPAGLMRTRTKAAEEAIHLGPVGVDHE